MAKNRRHEDGGGFCHNLLKYLCCCGMEFVFYFYLKEENKLNIN